MPSSPPQHLKRVPDQANFCLPAGERNGNDIKPARLFFDLSFKEIAFGNFPDLFLLLWRDRIFGRAKRFGSACFNLDEDELITIPGDKIDLSPLKPVVSLHDPIP